MIVRIRPAGPEEPENKLANAFIEWVDGPLEGLELVGFELWYVSGPGDEVPTVTFPSREEMMTDGQVHIINLFRPTANADGIVDWKSTDKLNELIVAAYEAWRVSRLHPIPEDPA